MLTDENITVEAPASVKNDSTITNRRLMGAFCRHAWTLIQVWTNNYTHYSVRDAITYPFVNFNGATVDVLEWTKNFIPHFIGHVITYPS